MYRSAPTRFSTQTGFFAALLVVAMMPNAFGQTQPEPDALQAALILQESIVEAIEKAESSVVSIARVRRDDLQPGELTLNEEARAFFQNFNSSETDPTSPDFVPNEFGSGVVVDNGGLVLTNYHVLGDVNKNRYYVWANRKPYLAKVKAADPMMDLAVLETGATELQPIEFGESKGLRKGQIVITLGNPYAIASDGQPSASWGIIANLLRKAPAIPERSTAPRGRETLHHYGSLLQIDASHNFGTSGGAVLNLQGQMIGLATSLTPGAGYERAGGFAIPVDDVFLRSVNQLKKGLVAEYGFLGVQPEPISVAWRRQGRMGALIQAVVAGTPAAEAGLEGGDIITHLNNEPVFDDSQLFRQLSSQPVHAEVLLTVRRGATDDRQGRVLHLTAKLSKKYIETSRPAISQVAPRSWRGLTVDYATAIPPVKLADNIGRLDPNGCVAVLTVERDSPAWLAGLRDAVFVSHVENKRVTAPGQFYAAVADAAGDVRLQVASGEVASRTIVVAP